MTETPAKPPFFIVSSGRAGSTLLSTILNNSNEVFVPPESDFIARAYPFFANRSSFSDSDYIIISRFFCRTSQGSWGMTEEEVAMVLRSRRPQTFAEVNAAIYEAYLASINLNGRRWGIKRPLLIASIDRIRNVFPDAKIVHIYRDGRDVYLSYRAAHQKGFTWGPGGPISAPLYWVDGLRRIPEAACPVHEVRYEELVVHPERTLQGLCAYLEIQYSDDLLQQRDPGGGQQIVLEKHKDFVHKKIFDDVDATNINKYRSQLSRIQTATFECIAAPLLKRYEYPTTLPTIVQLIMRPFQELLFHASRILNDHRYKKREKRVYGKVCAGNTADNA